MLAPCRGEGWGVGKHAAQPLEVALHGQLRRRFLALTGVDPDAGSHPGLLEGFGAALAHDFGALALGPELLGQTPPRGAVRSLLAGPMRMAAYLGAGTHLAILYLALAVAAVRPDLAFWTVVIAVGALKAWALLVILAWRRAEGLVRRLAPA